MADSGLRLTVPDGLLHAARNRNLSIFVGAGFTRNISKDIPDAERLIEFAARHAKIDKRLLNIHAKGDYMLVAEYLEIEGVLTSALRDLEQAIHDKSFTVLHSRPHMQLTSIDCEHIFTTNWDNWIEFAFEQNRIPYKSIRSAGDLIAKTNIKHSTKKPVRIVKFHGDFQVPETIVFTMKSFFSRILSHTPFESILEADIFSNSLLFLGYSFADPNLRLIWNKLIQQRTQLPEYALQSIPRSYILSNDVNPIMTAWLSRLGIDVIAVDPSPAKLKDSVEFVLDKVTGAQK